jgi:phosphatidylinositol alpha-mannosyltransferase
MFHGFVSQEDKRDMMGRCGVFTSPALYGESFGIVVVEAMAMGAPVVAGDNPGYATVMTGRGSLSLVDPKDTIAYARLLELFLSDQEFVELWRQWAKSAVKEFDWPKVVDKYVELYDSLVSSKQ